jgi:hypothetical protein
VAPAHLVKYLASGPSSVVGDVVQALPDCLIHIGACGDVGAISFAGCFVKPLDERGTSAFSGVNCPRRFLATEEKLRL